MANQGDNKAGAMMPAVATVSPYTLASSDNPGALISPIILNGTNYNEWSVEMLNALQAKRKIGFVNGTLTKPDVGDPNHEEWQVVNSMIVGWLRASIEPKVRSTVSFISDASLLWKDLKERFSVKNNVHVHQLKLQVTSCRQNGRSVVEYYSELCSLWEELQVYSSANRCVCEAKKEISKEREEEKLHQFVMGLDDSKFGNICATIIGLDPLPSLGEAYSRVIREEQRIVSTVSHEQRHGAVGL